MPDQPPPALSSPLNPWKMAPIVLGTDVLPTWAEHSVRPYQSVMEMGTSLGSEYPYFEAVLTPERTFLHYLISTLICNVSIPDRKFLAEQVDRLYKAHVGEVTERYNDEKSALAGDKAGYLQEAASFFEHKTKNAPYGLGQQDPLASQFEVVYQTIEKNMNDRRIAYMPGKIDRKGLNDFKKIFLAICGDEFERERIVTIAKQTAQKIIQAETKGGRLTPLKFYGRGQCRNTVIAGIMAAGKTRLLKHLQSSGQIDRATSVVIDVDEFRDLDLIVDKSHDDPLTPRWGTRAHDECHMIRRKILDELEEKAARKQYPNMVLMTANLSPRIRRWITEGNPDTKLYFLYCDPKQAVNNAFERSKKDKRWLPTESILTSFVNLAMSLRYLFGIEIGTGNNLSIEILDTTNARTTDQSDGTPITSDMKRILTADKSHGVQIFNLEQLIEAYRGFFINTQATSPHPRVLYQADHEADLYETVRASLRPHLVKFMGKHGEYVEKPRETDEIPGEIPRTLASSSAFRNLFLNGNNGVGSPRIG